MSNKQVVLVTGGTGMVGRAIQNNITDQLSRKYEFHFVGSKNYNLLRYDETERMFQEISPDKVIHLAAKVGGVKANTDYVADFFDENVLMNTAVLRLAHRYGVQDLVSLLSTCVFPDADWVEYPLTENQLHNGPPHQSNFGYAYAKRMLEVQSRAYRKQCGRNYVAAIPNNIYGPHDNFDLENGHVAPAVIRKIYEAKVNNVTPIFWGDGSALREFTHSDDIAVCLLKMIGVVGEYTSTNKTLCNIGTDEEISIKNLVETVASMFEYDGEIAWDASKPAGQKRKPSRKGQIMHEYKTVHDGLQETCNWFKANYPNVRGVVE